MKLWGGGRCRLERLYRIWAWRNQIWLRRSRGVGELGIPWRTFCGGGDNSSCAERSEGKREQVSVLSGNGRVYGTNESYRRPFSFFLFTCCSLGCFLIGYFYDELFFLMTSNYLSQYFFFTFPFRIVVIVKVNFLLGFK